MRGISFALLFSSVTLGAEPLGAARDAFVKGQYKEAIRLAQPHVSDDPDQAWRVIGASYCFLKDKDGAAGAWQHLDDKGRSFLKYVCSRNGVTLP